MVFPERPPRTGSRHHCDKFLTSQNPFAYFTHARTSGEDMIRKLKSGEYRLYSRKKNPKTGKRRNLGTFKTRAAAQKHERAVQFFKRA
jgi:hypothetical protein